MDIIKKKGELKFQNLYDNINKIDYKGKDSDSSSEISDEEPEENYEDSDDSNEDKESGDNDNVLNKQILLIDKLKLIEKKLLNSFNINNADNENAIVISEQKKYLNSGDLDIINKLQQNNESNKLNEDDLSSVVESEKEDNNTKDIQKKLKKKFKDIEALMSNKARDYEIEGSITNKNIKDNNITSSFIDNVNNISTYSINKSKIDEVKTTSNTNNKENHSNPDKEVKSLVNNISKLSKLANLVKKDKYSSKVNLIDNSIIKNTSIKTKNASYLNSIKENKSDNTDTIKTENYKGNLLNKLKKNSKNNDQTNSNAKMSFNQKNLKPIISNKNIAENNKISLFNDTTKGFSLVKLQTKREERKIILSKKVNKNNDLFKLNFQYKDSDEINIFDNDKIFNKDKEEKQSTLNKK